MFVISGSEIDEITGCKRGRTMSLSISTNDAEEGGGIGDILRSIPKYASMSMVFMILIEYRTSSEHAQHN